MMDYEVRLWKPDAGQLVMIATSPTRNDACVVAEALYKTFGVQIEVWKNDGVHSPQCTDRMDKTGWEMWDEPAKRYRKCSLE